MTPTNFMSDTEIPSIVGMIAGNGIYPETFARAARRAGVKSLVAAAFTDETYPGLKDLVDQL